MGNYKIGGLKTTVFLMDVRPLQEKETFFDYFDQVSLDRQIKLKRLKSSQARALSLGAGLLLNELLSKWGIDRQTPMIRNDKGKPFLKNYPNCHFNLSHSGDFVVCASAPQAVGIDIQKMQEANLKVAKRFFHEKEFEFLAQLSGVRQKLAFNQIWTGKESYLKYLGSGLATPLNSFEFQIDPAGGHGHIPGESVYFKNYQGPENYLIWTCTGSDDFDQRLKKITLKRGGTIG